MNLRKGKAVKINLKQFQQRQEKDTQPQKQVEKTVQMLCVEIEKTLSKQQAVFEPEQLHRIDNVANSIKSWTYFELIHQDILNKKIEIFEKNRCDYMVSKLNSFKTKVLEILDREKQQRMNTETTTMIFKQSAGDQYEKYRTLHYSLQIKEKQDEIQRKKKFKEYGEQNYKEHIENIQKFIDQQSTIIDQETIQENFTPIFNNVKRQNEEILKKKQHQCDNTYKKLIQQMVRIRKEKKMLSEIKRGSKLIKNQNYHRVMSNKFPKLLGILVNPFNVFGSFLK